MLAGTDVDGNDNYIMSHHVFNLDCIGREEGGQLCVESEEGGQLV